MPTISSKPRCPHCGMGDISEFLGPTAKAVESRGICSNCLRWIATGQPAYAEGRVPLNEADALSGKLEINGQADAAAGAGSSAG